MRSLLPRAALGLLAILLIAWFAVLLHNERTGREAGDRLYRNPEMSDAAWNRFIDQLRGAELLDPRTKWRVARAAHLVLRDKDEAVQVADSVLRREPDNLDAWLVVRNATRGRDATRSAQASREIRRISPIAARAR